MNRRLAALLALRYLRGKRRANAVPILSRISMLAIAVGSAAMIILFSVINGFEGVVSQMYTSFYPDIRISPASGKFFRLPAGTLDRLAHHPSVAGVAPVIEDNVFVINEEEQVVVTLLGVDNRYFRVNDLKPYVKYGRDTLTPGPLPTAIVGMHIAARLGLDYNNDFSRMHLHYPNSKAGNLALNPVNAYQSLELKPDGIFRVQDEFDEKYVLAPIGLVQQLFGEEGSLSSVQLRLQQGADPDRVQRELKKLLGPACRVETRFEQNHTLYQVMRTEKWATYAILLFIMLIASVNMIGALSLLVLEKRKDMAILAAMGASRGTIRSVFLAEGVLWALVGGTAGLAIGALICWLQQRFGLVELGGSFLIKAYPVALQGTDFLLVLGTVVGVGLLVAWYPATRAASGSPGDGENLYAGLR